MKHHLDDHAIDLAVAGLELEASVREHLETCVTCRRRVRSFTDLVEHRRREIEQGAPDWDRQQREILLRLPTIPAARSRRLGPWFTPLLAAAAAVLVAVGLDVMRAPAPTARTPVNLDIPVEQILAEADAVLDDETIPGFELIDPGVDDLDVLFENGAS